MSNSARSSRFLAIAGPIMLLLGFGCGAISHGSINPFVLAINSNLDTIGTVWLNALKVVVVPITVSLLIVGIGSLPTSRELGKWGGTSVLSFLGLLLCGVAFALTIGFVSVRLVPPPTIRIEPLPVATSEAVGGFAEWFTSLIPSSFFEAVSKGDLLPIAIMSTLFALAVRKIDTAHRDLVLSLFTAIREALLVYVRWVMMMLPIGGFALAYSLIAKTGIGFAAATVQFLTYAALLLLTFGAALYFLVAIIGRVSLRVFSRAALPAQIMAVGSRSSVACLPSMVESADAMELPAPASQFCIPMAVSILKLNRSITAPSKLIFFATVFGVALQPNSVFAFVVTTLLISFSTPGLPSGAGASNFGAYVAAGLPAEGVALFEAINPILDPINTAINVTGDLAAAAITSRLVTGSGK